MSSTNVATSDTIDPTTGQALTSTVATLPIPVITNARQTPWDGGAPETSVSFEPPASMRNLKHVVNSVMRSVGGIVPLLVVATIATPLMVHDLITTLILVPIILTTISIGCIRMDLEDGRDGLERGRIENAKRRLTHLIDDESSRRPGISYALHLLKESGSMGEDGIPLLVRLDPVLRRYDALTSKVGHDADVVIRARSIAIDAIERISLDHKASNGSDEQALLASFEKECLAIGDGRDPTTPTRLLIPSARISRIIETAERALEAHPDLTDGNGSRIDALVRTHVPRLLETHATAAGTATSREMEAVDEALDQAVELVRASVEEGVSRLHDEAMSALATELRFLSLRKGDVPLLSVVA